MHRLLPALVLGVLALPSCHQADATSGARANAPAGSSASLLAFAGGGAAPRFDKQVDVFVGGDRALTLTREQASDAEAWTTDDGSLLDRITVGQLDVPPTCQAVPSPVVPGLGRPVDVDHVSVLWQPDACDFAVVVVIDHDRQIAAVVL